MQTKHALRDGFSFIRDTKVNGNKLTYGLIGVKIKGLCLCGIARRFGESGGAFGSRRFRHPEPPDNCRHKSLYHRFCTS